MDHQIEHRFCPHSCHGWSEFGSTTHRGATWCNNTSASNNKTIICTQETDGKAAMFLEWNGARKQLIRWWCAVPSLVRFSSWLVKHIDIGIAGVRFSGMYSIPRPREIIDQQIDLIWYTGMPQTPMYQEYAPYKSKKMAPPFHQDETTIGQRWFCNL